jgi:hypothetical protein
MDKERLAAIAARGEQIKQTCAHGYIWNSTTQELLPILPPDHPQYRESMDRVLAAIRRWNRGTSR